MPRYFFDIMDGNCLPDHVGSDLPDDEAAGEHAITIAETMLRERMQTASLDPWDVMVRDEGGEVVAVVKSSAV